MDIHKSPNELLPQQSPTMSGESFHREMDNYREGQKVLSHCCNSYWQENNNSVVVSQTTGKHECGLSPYFCLRKSLFVLNMSHSSPSVAQHTTWPWPNVVGFLIGVTKHISQTHFTLTCVALLRFCEQFLRNVNTVVRNSIDWVLALIPKGDALKQAHALTHMHTEMPPKILPPTHKEVSATWENNTVNRKHGRKNAKCILQFQLQPVLSTSASISGKDCESSQQAIIAGKKNLLLVLEYNNIVLYSQINDRSNERQ